MARGNVDEDRAETALSRIIHLRALDAYALVAKLQLIYRRLNELKSGNDKYVDATSANNHKSNEHLKCAVDESQRGMCNVVEGCNEASGSRTCAGSVLAQPRLRVLVVDNVASAMTPVITGYTNPSSSAMLSEVGVLVRSIAIEFDVAVILTNNVVGDRSRARGGEGNGRGGLNSFASTKPALGRPWSYAPSIRVFLECLQDKIQGNDRVAIVTKSPRIAAGANVFFKLP
jgi:hypothetical protein